jgi:hypothetical protein
VYYGDKSTVYGGRSPWTAPGPLTRPDPARGSGCGSGEPPPATRRNMHYSRTTLVQCLCLLTVLAGCGYHTAGHVNLVPKSVKTIAVPAFANNTTRYKLANQLAGAVTREFIARTRYKIVADPNAADAVLEGVLINYASYPTVFDQQTGRASGVQANVTLSLTLRDRATGAVILQRPSMDVREHYEISTNPLAFMDESDTALERVSRDVARGVVSAILSSF